MWSHHIMANRWRQWQTIFLGSKITADGDYSQEYKRPLLLGRKAMTNLDSVLKSSDITFWQRSYSQSYDFSRSHVWMWELDHKEGWMLKNWCFQIVVLKKTPESPLDSKEIKPNNPKGNQPWIFIGRTEAEASILWPPDWEEPTHWKRPWCWERLKAREGSSRGWDG